MTFWITVLLIILLDRTTKYLIGAHMKLAESIPIINGFFHLTYVKNPGAAFGMLADKRWLFIVITLVMLGIIVYTARNSSGKNTWFAVALGMVAGGAFGNLVDRVKGGLVIDFIDFRGIWPYIFNIADSAIVVGVILLAWQVLKPDRRRC
ncbi:MAG: signal peptidase II [Peptococcaceae bacterium]|jgi:signal peptidase II|nr:signal peptidase II [Peptococcaceae bacterium]MDH7524307.1 signal peptidase II [Peptococcaceae bacterium]